MYPPPPPPADECEVQAAVRGLSLQIRDAVAQADINRVCELSLAQHQLLRQACAAGNGVGFSDSFREEFIRESESWITALDAHQTQLTAKLELLRTHRNTQRILSRAYNNDPTTVAQCFTHRG